MSISPPVTIFFGRLPSVYILDESVHSMANHLLNSSIVCFHPRSLDISNNNTFNETVICKPGQPDADQHDVRAQNLKNIKMKLE